MLNKNANGIVSLGVAGSGLMQKELVAYFNNLELKPEHLSYSDGPYGSHALRAALSTFINRHFPLIKLIQPSNIVVASGVTAVLDLDTFAIADEGERILIGRPLYAGFRNDL